MDIDRLKAQLRKDEGYRRIVYRDPRGYLTVGVGHRVVPSDHLHEWDVVKRAEAEQLFEADVERTLQGCARRIQGWESLPEEIQEILANMAFNLGISGLLKFKRTLAAIYAGQYGLAADYLTESLWFQQVGKRAQRLISRLRKLHVHSISA